MKRVDELREQLHEAINRNSGNLLSPEVMEISQKLDEAVVAEQRQRLSVIDTERRVG